jgi:hypothetical protein
MRPKRGVDRYTPGAYIALEKSWSEESRRPRQLRVLREPERVILVSARQYAFTLTVKMALRTYKEKAEESIMKEMVNMLEKDVFIGIKWDTLSASQKTTTIRSSLFPKEKYTSTENLTS